MHTMKAVEMKEWAVYLFKLAVLRDLFEIRDIGDILRERTDFSYGNAALGQYLKGKRNPPPNFFDYVKEALELTEAEYQILLYMYHSTKPEPSRVQEEQMKRFKNDLLSRIVQNITRENGLGGIGAAS